MFAFRRPSFLEPGLTNQAEPPGFDRGAEVFGLKGKLQGNPSHLKSTSVTEDC